MSEKMMDEFNAICESDLWSWMNEDQKLAAYSLWQSAWQASRSALVVELPGDISGEYYADGWNAALMCVEGMLEEAGVSYR